MEGVEGVGEVGGCAGEGGFIFSRYFTEAVELELALVTDAVVIEHAVVTVEVGHDVVHEAPTEYVVFEEAADTGLLDVEPETDTEALDEALAVKAESAAVLARAAWCLAARWRFFSLSDGPRCRGRRGGEEWGGGAGAGGAGGREWEAPGLPIVQLNPTVVTPLLVERLRLALPPRFQTDINSVTDAIKN